jgi:hypothetical protein
MSATGTSQPGPETPLARELGGAGLLFMDLRLRSLLIAEARHRAITRVFGTRTEDQSALATLILLGAGAAVLRDLMPRPWPRPSRRDAALGGSLMNASLRGLAGAPSNGMPLAGGLIAAAILSHSLRPAVVGTAREVRALTREARAAFGARYGR